MIFRKAVSEENLNADGSVLCLCVLPAHQAEDETWQCFPAVLFWSLGWWFCIPSAHPEKEVSLCTCLIIFLTRNVWKKLPYVILGWPEGRMLTSDSRWFSVCSEGHSSIPLLNYACQQWLFKLFVDIKWSCHGLSVKLCRQMNWFSGLYQILFYINCIYNFYI